jgi:hypothetical protein
MSTNTPTTIYFPVPATEEANKEGIYIGIDKNGREFPAIKIDGEWVEITDFVKQKGIRATEYIHSRLKKVTGYFHTKEELEKLLGDAYLAGRDFEYVANFGKIIDVPDSKEDYVKSVLNL